MLKKLTVLILTVLFITALSSFVVSANSLVYVTCDVLNIRNCPSTSGEVLGQARYRDSLELLGQEGDWFKIYYWGVTGYVCGDYVSYTQPEALSIGEQVVEYAKTLTGIPYKYGGNTPQTGFDCSGFVKYVFAQFGVTMPRTSYSQLTVGTPVTREELRPGDLVGFRQGGHVGIYCGDNKYIHAPQSGRVVSVEEMNRTLYSARRIVY